MEIRTDRAFQILDAYCQHRTRLQFGGRISGEEAASIAEVTCVSPIAESITVKLYSSDDDGRSWDIFVPLKGANFSSDQVGDASVEQSEWVPSCHLALYAWFVDGTILFFAEDRN